VEKLSDKVIERIRDESLTYEELQQWAVENYSNTFRMIQLDCSIQTAIDSGKVVYDADYKYRAIG
jgi:hypothetical protein